MASSGGSERDRPGGMFLNATALEQRFTIGSPDGVHLVSGTVFWPQSQKRTMAILL